MRDLLSNLQKSGTWKVQLTIAINFIFSEDADKKQVMHSKSDSVELMTYDNVDDIVDELFVSLFSRYQIGLEISVRGSDFIFDSVQVLHYKCQKINFKRGGSSIDFPDWIKKEKATINPKIKIINVFNMPQQLL